MANLVLLEDSHATAFADDVHKVAVVKLVGSEKQLVISQLVVASLVVALEPDLV